MSVNSVICDSIMSGKIFFGVNDKRFLSYLLKFLLNEFQLSVQAMIMMMDVITEINVNLQKKFKVLKPLKILIKI